MFIRPLLVFLLIASMTTATMGRAPLKQDDTQDQAKQEVLTPDEENEARALAEEFITRLEKSEDVTPLVKDLYVSGFTERLRDRMDGLFPLAATPEVAAQMSSDEILRAYAASINCIYLASRLYIEFERKHEQEKAQRGDTAEQEEEPDPTIEELIPPSIIKLIESDPVLAALFEQAKKDEQEERRRNQSGPAVENAPTSEADRESVSQVTESFEDLFPFRSLEQMRHYTSLTEQAVTLLREHINSLPLELKPSVSEALSKSKKESTDEEASEAEDTINPRLHVLSNEFMGYSVGTHIICANALIFHMDMVRGADGRFKIMSVYLVMD